MICYLQNLLDQIINPVKIKTKVTLITNLLMSAITFTFHFCALEKEMATHSCSCLENPRDAGAWWAAVYGVVDPAASLQ